MRSGRKSSRANDPGSQLDAGSLAFSRSCAKTLLGTPLAKANVKTCFRAGVSSRTAGWSDKRSGTGMRVECSGAMRAEGGYPWPVSQTLVVDNPYTLEPACSVELAEGPAVDTVLDRATEAARAARSTSVAERVALCVRATEAMLSARDDIARDI